MTAYRRTLLVTFVCVLISAIVVSCRERSKSNIVRLGVILSLTGTGAPYGEDNLRGLQLAADRINAAGGINGKQVELVVHDSAGEPAQAVTLARRFAADPSMTAILGPTRTGETVAVAKLLPTLQIPMISVGSTGDWKSAAGTFNEWTFRSTRVDTFLVPPLMRTARDKYGIRRVAAIYTANDDWSVSVMNVYEQAIRELGLELIAKESQMSGDADRSPQLTRIAHAKPDALIINTLSTDAPSIAAQARRLGLTVRLIGTAGFSNPTTWKLAGPGALEGTLLADNFFIGRDSGAVKEFVQAYRAKYKTDPPPYAGYAYDGFNILADAMKRAGADATRKGVRDAIATTKDFDGVLGRLTYTGPGDAIKEPIILTIAGDSYKQIG